MPLVATPVAVGVYAFLGDVGEPDLENRGEVGNGGFIVGDRGTIMINTGASYRHGRRMIEAAQRIGGRPVLLAVITQPLQEYVMGSAAFAERGIPVLAQSAAATLIGQRCDNCLRNLVRLLGDDAMAGTRVLTPERQVAGSEPLDVGGRRLELLHFGWAQTPGDLAVWDPESGVLFAGALVSNGRVPVLRDADPEGWRHALEQLERLPVKALVPGYGPPGERRDLAPTADYLNALQTRVGALVDQGASLGEAIAAAPLPRFESWALYGSVHPANVQTVYLRLENRAFSLPAP